MSREAPPAAVSPSIPTPSPSRVTIAPIAQTPDPTPETRDAQPTGAESPTPQQAIVAPAKPPLTYEDVITEKQRAVLRERATAFGLDVKRLDLVLTVDEREQLDRMIREREAANP